MSYIVTLIVLSAVVYRTARFVVLDSLIDKTRERVFVWLVTREHIAWHKLHELLGCPFCITIWFAAAVVAIHHNFVDPLPAPIWTWVAVAAGSLLWWRAIDWEDE